MSLCLSSVAIQCLEAAFEVNPVDGTLHTNQKLEKIFEDYLMTNEKASVLSKSSENRR